MSCRKTKLYVGRIKVRCLGRVGRVRVVGYGGKVKVESKS